jgi:hypothetical protein
MVGKALSVGVADGENQTIVEVGGGVSEGGGVSAGGVDSDGRQELRMRNPDKRNERIVCLMK